MTTPSIKDIPIGQNAAIDWIELKDPDAAHEIDPLLEPTLDFWKSLKTRCDPECCGIYAYDLFDENIAAAMSKSEDVRIIKKLIELRQAIDELDASTLTSNHINNLFDKSVFLQLVDHLIGSARQAQENMDS